jgi:hypothetical protein
MRRTSVVAGAAGAAVAAAGAVALVQRRRAAEQVELVFEDGGSVELDRGSEDRDRLLEVAREALDVVRA